MNLEHLSPKQENVLYEEINRAVLGIFMDKLRAYNEKNYTLQHKKRVGKRIGMEYFDIIEPLYRYVFDMCPGLLISSDYPEGIPFSIFELHILKFAESASCCIKTLKERLARLSDAGLISYRIDGYTLIMRLSLEIQSKIDEISAPYANGEFNNTNSERLLGYQIARAADHGNFWVSPELERFHLPRTEKNMMIQLILLAQGQCFPGNPLPSPAVTFTAHLSDLAYRACVSERTVKSSLKKLEEGTVIAKQACGRNGQLITMPRKFISNKKNINWGS